MTSLSPQAQAVKDAVLALYSDEKVHGFGWQLDAPTVVAALRAAADQVVLDESAPPDDPPTYEIIENPMDSIRYVTAILQRQEVRAQILAIAAELEGVTSR